MGEEKRCRSFSFKRLVSYNRVDSLKGNCNFVNRTNERFAVKLDNAVIPCTVAVVVIFVVRVQCGIK